MEGPPGDRRWKGRPAACHARAVSDGGHGRISGRELGATAIWLPVAAVVGAGIVAAVHVGKVAIATPMLRADLGIGLAQAGWLMAIVAALGAVGGLPAGALTSVVDARRALLGGLLAITVAAAAGAMSHAVPLLMAARFVEGIGFLAIAVAGPAVLQQFVPQHRRSLAYGLWSCFMPAGMALVMMAGPQLGHWRAIWWAGAALALALFALGASVIPRPAPRVGAPAASPGAGIGAMLGHAQPWLLGLCFALYSVMFFAVFSFLPVLLIERMGAGHATVGALTALAIAANMAGNLAAGWLLARGIAPAPLVAGASVAMGLAALGILLPLFGDRPTFLLCVLFSAIGGLIPATLIASAPLVARSAAMLPVMIGLLMQGSNLGQAIGPVTVGAVIDTYGWTAAAAIVAAAAVGTALSARALPGSGNRPAAAQT